LKQLSKVKHISILYQPCCYFQDGYHTFFIPKHMWLWDAICKTFFLTQLFLTKCVATLTFENIKTYIFRGIDFDARFIFPAATSLHHFVMGENWGQALKVAHINSRSNLRLNSKLQGFVWNIKLSNLLNIWEFQSKFLWSTVLKAFINEKKISNKKRWICRRKILFLTLEC